MEERATSGYIRIGTAIRYLIDCREGGEIFASGAVRTNLDLLSRSLTRYEMHVTRRVARDLFLFASELDEELSSHAGDPAWSDERRLTKSEAARVSERALSVRTTMIAEAQGQIAFITRDKRYDIQRLLHDVGGLMAPKIFNSLPPLAQYDFSQAGRCTAFEVPTAAAFHLMRGTEAVLREFYRRLILRDRLKVQTWAAVTDHLKKRRKPPPEVLMQNLDNLRKSFRNPTQHPEKVYDIEEVQDLFALSIDVVNRMMNYLFEQGK